MSISVKKNQKTDYRNEHHWVISPPFPDEKECWTTSSSSTIEVKLTGKQMTEDELDQVMDDVIYRNKELYKRLAK